MYPGYRVKVKVTGAKMRYERIVRLRLKGNIVLGTVERQFQNLLSYSLWSVIACDGLIVRPRLLELDSKGLWG